MLFLQYYEKEILSIPSTPEQENLTELYKTASGFGEGIKIPDGHFRL